MQNGNYSVSSPLSTWNNQNEEFKNIKKCDYSSNTIDMNSDDYEKYVKINSNYNPNFSPQNFHYRKEDYNYYTENFKNGYNQNNLFTNSSNDFYSSKYNDKNNLLNQTKNIFEKSNLLKNESIEIYSNANSKFNNHPRNKNTASLINEQNYDRTYKNLDTDKNTSIKQNTIDIIFQNRVTDPSSDETNPAAYSNKKNEYSNNYKYETAREKYRYDISSKNPYFAYQENDASEKTNIKNNFSHIYNNDSLENSNESKNTHHFSINNNNYYRDKRSFQNLNENYIISDSAKFNSNIYNSDYSQPLYSESILNDPNVNNLSKNNNNLKNIYELPNQSNINTNREYLQNYNNTKNTLSYTNSSKPEYGNYNTENYNSGNFSSLKNSNLYENNYDIKKINQLEMHKEISLREEEIRLLKLEITRLNQQKEEFFNKYKEEKEKNINYLEEIEQLKNIKEELKALKEKYDFRKKEYKFLVENYKKSEDTRKEQELLINDMTRKIGIENTEKIIKNIRSKNNSKAKLEENYKIKNEETKENIASLEENLGGFENEMENPFVSNLLPTDQDQYNMKLYNKKRSISKKKSTKIKKNELNKKNREESYSKQMNDGINYSNLLTNKLKNLNTKREIKLDKINKDLSNFTDYSKNSLKYNVGIGLNNNITKKVLSKSKSKKK